MIFASGREKQPFIEKEMKRKHTTAKLLIITQIVAVFSIWTPAVASTIPKTPDLFSWLASPDPFIGQISPMNGDFDLDQVMRFYQKVGVYPVWTGPSGLLYQGKTLVETIANAPRAGFITADYLPPDPEAPIHGIRYPGSTAAPHMQLDVMLTAGLIRYATHLSQGRVNPETLSGHWVALRRSAIRDIPAELAIAVRQGRLVAYIESLHPRTTAYEKLRDALKQYEVIERAGGWHMIEPGPSLHTGDVGPRVAALVRRLCATGDISDQIPPDYKIFDETVAEAVGHFQRRHGLTADGVVGKQTLGELNVSVQARIRKIKLNMERWRWYPDDLGDRYIWVNIPSFALNVVDGDRTVHTSRVIVGKRSRKTPIMSGQMTYLEVNPYWNIPRKIVRKNIIPKAAADPAYLIRQGIRVFESWDEQARELDPLAISWEKLSRNTFPYRLRQDPSQLNALGQVKFMFPNAQSVYIHDTPGKNLFDRRIRTFSSGCVRLENPICLAQYLLKDQGWDRRRLESAVANEKRKTIILDNPINVHLAYFTAWVDQTGQVHFAKDIYDRDRRLLLAMEGAASKTIRCENEEGKGTMLAKSDTAGHL